MLFARRIKIYARLDHQRGRRRCTMLYLATRAGVGHIPAIYRQTVISHQNQGRRPHANAACKDKPGKADGGDTLSAPRTLFWRIVPYLVNGFLVLKGALSPEEVIKRAATGLRTRHLEHCSPQ